MNWKLSLVPGRVSDVLSILTSLALMVVLAFSLNALFAPHSSQPMGPSEPEKLPPQAVAAQPFPSLPGRADPTVDWTVYRNEEVGFEIKYPKDAVAGVDLAPGAVEGAVVSFRLANDKHHSSTNLREASVIVGVRQDEEALSRCLKLEPGSSYKYPKYQRHSLPKHEISTITFYQDFVEEGAAGHQYQRTSYRTIHKDRCFEIAWLIHSINMGVFDPGTVSEFYEGAVTEKLNQVVSTFRFLE